MSEKSDGKRTMPQAINWQNEISALAGPMRDGDTRESWLNRAARKSGATFRQIKTLYYGESSNPKFDVGISVLTAAEKARKEALELAKKFELLAGAMNANDQNFCREDVLTLVDAARRLRGMDRA